MDAKEKENEKWKYLYRKNLTIANINSNDDLFARSQRSAHNKMQMNAILMNDIMHLSYTQPLIVVLCRRRYAVRAAKHKQKLYFSTNTQKKMEKKRFFLFC